MSVLGRFGPWNVDSGICGINRSETVREHFSRSVVVSRKHTHSAVGNPAERVQQYSGRRVTQRVACDGLAQWGALLREASLEWHPMSLWQSHWGVVTFPLPYTQRCRGNTGAEAAAQAMMCLPWVQARDWVLGAPQAAEADSTMSPTFSGLSAPKTSRTHPARGYVPGGVPCQIIPQRSNLRLAICSEYEAFPALSAL